MECVLVSGECDGGRCGYEMWRLLKYPSPVCGAESHGCTMRTGRWTQFKMAPIHFNGKCSAGKYSKIYIVFIPGLRLCCAAQNIH